MPAGRRALLGTVAGVQKVTILDYGSGNLRSAERALARVGADVTVTADARTALDADGLVVPGVGAFAACMAGLRAVDGPRIIDRRLAGGRPVLGICVGMQILFDRGVEHGHDADGCGEWPGVVEQLKAPVLPHMGWNTVETPRDSVLFDGPADEFLARRIVDLLESAYARIGESLRAYPTGTITVVLYTTQQFQDVTRMPSWTAASYDGRIHVPVRGALQQTEQLDRVLTHEFVHAVVAQIGGPAVPVWVNEGLATAMEPGSVVQSKAVLAAATVRPHLQQLHGTFSGLDAAQARLAYAYSAYAVQRVIDLRGAYAVVGLLRDLARGVDFGSAFGKHAEMRYEEFDAMVSRDSR